MKPFSIVTALILASLTSLSLTHAADCTPEIAKDLAIADLNSKEFPFLKNEDGSIVYAKAKNIKVGSTENVIKNVILVTAYFDLEAEDAKQSNFGVYPFDSKNCAVEDSKKSWYAAQ